jgi:RNA polymerase sigma-B factor/RNA polymerase sporulation-specific sigma factor
MNNINRCKEDAEYLGEAMLANENLIWHSIHKYIGKPETIASNHGLEKDDILQLGRMGFIKAMKAFDTERGIKFSSFAVTAIVREVRCYIRDSSNIIRLTRTAHTLLNDIRKVEAELGYSPSTEDLAVLLNESEDKITKALQLGKPIKYLDENVQMADGGDTQYSQMQLIEDTGVPIDFDVVDKVYIESIIDSIRDKLTDTEIKVLYSQLDGYSQTQTAKEQNISQMKVSRIIKKIANLVKDSNLVDTNEGES